jgi:hypothetical protein
MLLAIIVSSCDVHEFPADIVTPGDHEKPELPTIVPGNEPIDPATPTYAVHFGFEYDTDMEINPYTISIESRADGTMKMRHTIRFYSGRNLDAAGTDIPLYSYVTVCDITDTPDFTKDLLLPAGDYTCVIWSEYVNNDVEDLYYNISDFHEIYITDKDNYTADTDYKDGFRGLQRFTVTEGSNSVTVSLKRPFAKYEIIATDLIDYISETQNISTGNVNISNYDIKVYYSGYTPSSFNLISNRATDSWSGLQYSGKPSYCQSNYQGLDINENDILLASDYIFVNDRETSVDLYFEIINRTGATIFQSAVITVPLLRSVDTIIIGTIGSNSSSSGAIINPDYEGSFDIIF